MCVNAIIYGNFQIKKKKKNIGKFARSRSVLVIDINLPSIRMLPSKCKLLRSRSRNWINFKFGQKKLNKTRFPRILEYFERLPLAYVIPDSLASKRHQLKFSLRYANLMETYTHVWRVFRKKIVISFQSIVLDFNRHK